jgi:hypothetical protein
MRGKGYPELLDALALLKAKGTKIHMVIYVGYGCNGLEDAKNWLFERTWQT